MLRNWSEFLAPTDIKDIHNTSMRVLAYESMHSLLTTVNSGIDFVLHAAGILSSFLAFSYEKFVIDDEMCGMVRRFRRGISPSEHEEYSYV